MNSQKFGPLLANVVIFGIVTGCATPSPRPAPVEPAPSVPEEVVDRTPVPPPPVDRNAFYASCGGKIDNLEDVLEPIVENMVAQKIPYTQNPANEWRDCSGNFLRLSSYLASVCPENQNYLIAPPGIRDYTPGGNNVAPSGVTARTSRAIAKWYQAQGRFTPIYYEGVTSPSEIPADLRKNRHLVRPGAVVWFSFGRPTSQDGLDALFEKKVSRGPHINHMATVTSVNLGEDGQVASFEMYHGRTTGKPGSVTKTHYWKWPDKYLKGDTKEYPSFGNWTQYLVGIAAIVPTVNGPRAD